MKRHWGTYRWLATLLLCMVAISACGQSYQYHGTVLDPPNAATDFTLTDHNGKPWTLSDQRGKVVLLFFGFTSCPDVCPTTLGEMKALKRELGTDAEHVQVALITVDPERDTAERMRQYVTAFDPSFVGLVGTPEELEPIYKAYGVTAIKRDLPNSELKYTLDHSTYTYVIDQQGRWPLLLRYGMDLKQLVSDVRHVIDNGEA